jgi:hypothetical protein
MKIKQDTMTTTPTTFTRLFTFQKYTAATIICIATIITLLGNPQYPLLLMGLFFLYISPSTPNDERSTTLKTTSLYGALILSYTGNLLAQNFFSHQLTDVNQFLILVFTLALTIYYTRFYTFR